MTSFRYQAIAADGATVKGSVDAESRHAALRVLGERGLCPTRLDEASNGTQRSTAHPPTTPLASAPVAAAPQEFAERPRGRISRKDITAFTRELATLLEATIPIPAALDGLGQQEENAALRHLITDLAAAVRHGNSLSSSMAKYPRQFSRLYTSMVEVGEEAGVLAEVLQDLADLLEHEDEIRGEVLGAVAYPCFVLAMGIVTTIVLLVFVMPRLFKMLQGMMDVLPLPTRMMLAISEFVHGNWIWILVVTIAAAATLRWYLRTPAGALWWDSWKLRLPLLGSVFRAAALGRFSRTLGTLEKSGVPLLPALEIVRNTVGNRLVAANLAQVAEETRGGDSLAVPLRKLNLFPPTMVQMIAVGEETGRLDTMLLRVASIQEKLVRGRSRTLVSLLAPALILVVGIIVGFIVISLLLPIFRMSQAIR